MSRLKIDWFEFRAISASFVLVKKSNIWKISKKNYTINQRVRCNQSIMSEISEEELLLNLKKFFKHSSFKSETQKKAIKNILQGEILNFVCCCFDSNSFRF